MTNLDPQIAKQKPWNEAGFFLGEDSFLEEMNDKVTPFRMAHYEEGDFPGCDFRSIHYAKIKHENEKAAIVISHGFCEFIRKYDEAIYYLYKLGYSVYVLEHRGHGFSFRYLDKPLDCVHAIDFEEYVDDLRCFMDTIVKKESPDVKYLLFAHSMGGAIAARMLERYPDYFQAAVLSSPMIEMATGGFPNWFVTSLTGFMNFIGKGKKFAPGNHGFAGTNDFETSSAQSAKRYQYTYDLRMQIPEYTTYGASYGWLAACLKGQKSIKKDAGKVQVPVMLFSAGLDSKVKPEGQVYFAEHSKNTKLVEYPNSKHEIFNALQEDREAYWNDVFTFLEQEAFN